MASEEWKAHSHESKSLNPPPPPRHTVILLSSFLSFLCPTLPLSAISHRVESTVGPCTCPLPFSLTHPRELLLPWEDLSAWLLSLYPSITHWHTHACRKVLLHTATNLAIIFSNIFFQTFTYGQNNCLWTLICSMYKITTSWDTGVPLPTSIYVVTVSLMQLKTDTFNDYP